MKNYLKLSISILIQATCLFIVLSCSDNEPIEIDAKPITKISLNSNGVFVDTNGNSFYPWGLNYTNPENVGLIEDNWINPDVWNTISNDFVEMKALNANVVRIHLQFNKFMNGPEEPNEESLNKLLELVNLAESKKLYLDITGLAAYRKSDSPIWYDNLDDNDRWKAQEFFWKSVANKVGNHNAVFAFNLMNEPVVSVGCTNINDCDWLVGNGFGGFHFIQNISRNPSRQFGQTIKEWIGQMSNAIRSEDNTTPITVGFLPLGDVAQFQDDLDFVSIHIYPISDKINESVNFVNNNLTTPLIIEETSNLNCSIDELTDFLDQVEGKNHGLMGHYHGSPINELSSFQFNDALRKQFLNMFVERNPN